MKGKSLVVQLFTLGITAIAGFSGLFSQSVQAWLGILAFMLTALLNSPILSTGTWPVGWAPVMWISNFSGLAIQLGNELADKALVDPKLVNYVILGINMLLFTFIKDYGTNTSIVKSNRS